MKLPFRNDKNLGLKILALILAIVVYVVLKNDPNFNDKSHERETFQNQH